MILISHRGNTTGPMESWENEPTYIDLAISKGYDVEVDVWYINGQLYLGHDKPQYSVNFKWFSDRSSKLWIHCKNIDAIIFFKTNEYKLNYFWHETDAITLTSLNYIWAYPGKQPIKYSIAVMPEIKDDSISQCLGICSDYITTYKD
jgi:hypothetical protein